MEAVGDLDRLGRASPRSFGIGAASVPTNHFHPWVLVEPSGQRLCLALRQQGDGSAYFEVDEDRPVTLPTLEGPVVNSQYPRRRGLFGEEALQQGKQGVGTDAKTQSRRQLGSCLSAESTPEQSQSLAIAV